MKDRDDWMVIDRKLYVNVPRFVVELEHMAYDVKSDDITNGGVISHEIRHEEPACKSDGISRTMRSPEINLKSAEFNLLLRGKEEVIESKDEVIESKKGQIEDMKQIYAKFLEKTDTMLNSKDDEMTAEQHARFYRGDAPDGCTWCCTVVT